MLPLTQHASLILASGSRIRQHLLREAGLAFSVQPSPADEDAEKARLQKAATPVAQWPEALAVAKGTAVSLANPECYVIAADQICVVGDKILSKPRTHAKATEQLHMLSGKTHQQICGVALLRGGECLWRFTDSARITLRALTADEIEHYLQQDTPYDACGSYHFEGHGKHLFARVEGANETVLGLPLIPLLAELYARTLLSLGTPHS